MNLPTNLPESPPTTLLVVDDNDFNRELLARRLSRAGYRVHQAEGVLHALAVLAERPTDLVLLDVMMPNIDGLDALRILRMRYAPAELPIIMVTARTAPEDLVAAFQRGANDYVTKPVDVPSLVARIDAQLAIARTDAHMGLPSRRWCQTLLDRALASNGPDQHIAVLAIDLDRLRDINERWGRTVGDDVLRAYGARMAAALGPHGMVAHLGGDEFMAFIAVEKTPDRADGAMARLALAFADPLDLDGIQIAMTAGIGLALSPFDGQDAISLLRRAEVGLARGKRALAAARVAGDETKVEVA